MTDPTELPEPTADLSHPAWCDPDRCELLREVRGLGDHRSAVYELPRAEDYDERITLWLSRFGYEPARETDTWINVRWSTQDRLGEPETVLTHTLRVVDAAHLSGTLAHLAELALDDLDEATRAKLAEIAAEGEATS